MSLSGLFLIAFLLVHAGLNACIWANDSGKMFNKAAHWMGANAVPRILEIGLFVFFLIHILQGIVVELQNRTKRGKGYAVSLGNRGSKWYSRSMGIMGAIILIFLALHLSDFWVPSRFGGLEPVVYGGKEYHNLYAEMQYKFIEFPYRVTLLYIVGVVALFWHLIHGFQSAFRTLGLTNHRYITLIQGLGWAFAIIVCAAFIMMPLSFYYEWIE